MSCSLVSVLMGVYYTRKNTSLLERSISSILKQSLSNLELLICDDGSSVQACTLLDTLAQRDVRIRLIRPGGVFTLPAKLNACLAEAKGEWIARMDDDDYSHPQRLELQIQYLESQPQFAFVGCNVNLYKENQMIGVRSFPKNPEVKDFYFIQPFIHPTLLFRKEALLAVQGYSEDKSCILCEDYDLLLRMYTKGYKGANLQESLFDYTLPSTVKGNRRMIHRWNETVTRYRRFRDLGVLPRAFPYVVKPLAVGLLPEMILKGLKKIS